MNRKQALNAAARQPWTSPNRVVVPVSRNLAARTQTVTHQTGPMRKSRAIKGTAAMRGGDGKRSLWAAPSDLPYYLSATTNDAKWTATVSG